jgi:hypothetical protein
MLFYTSPDTLDMQLELTIQLQPSVVSFGQVLGFWSPWEALGSKDPQFLSNKPQLLGNQSLLPDAKGLRAP